MSPSLRGPDGVVLRNARNACEPLLEGGSWPVGVTVRIGEIRYLMPRTMAEMGHASACRWCTLRPYCVLGPSNALLVHAAVFGCEGVGFNREPD